VSHVITGLGSGLSEAHRPLAASNAGNRRNDIDTLVVFADTSAARGCTLTIRAPAHHRGAPANRCPGTMFG
jgi:hypothetical protein